MRKLILLLLSFPTICFSNSLPVFEIDRYEPIAEIDPSFVEVAVSPESEFLFAGNIEGAADLNYQSFSGKLPYDKKIYWCRMRVHNNLGDDTRIRNWFYDIGRADYVEYYVLGGDGRVLDYQVTGEFVPKSKKSIQTRSFLERVHFFLEPDQTVDIYVKMQRVNGYPLRFEPGFQQTDYYLRSPFVDKVPQRHMFLGGLVSFMLFGLLIYLATHDKAFLYYSLFLFGLFGFLSDTYFYSLADTFWIGEHPKTIMMFNYTFIILLIIGYVAFLREFTELKRTSPRINRMAIGVILLNAGLLPVILGVYYFTLDENLTNQILLPLLMATSLFVFYMVFPLFKSELSKTIIYSVAIAIFIFFIGVVLNAINIYKFNNIHMSLTQWIITGKVFVFSISLAYRFSELQKEKLETERLKDLDELKSRLYQNITHEFRTPLTIIRGAVEQLFEKGTAVRKDYLEKRLETIERNGRNLLRLVNNMLDISKAETGKLKLDMKSGNVIGYLKYLTESVELLASSKNVGVQFVSGIEALEMDFDSEKLRRIVYNLLSNAIKFSPENERIIIKVNKLNKAKGDFLEIKIKDYGIGISEEDLPHVFERFYRAQNASRKEGEGTGIGLALTQRLVKIMSGELKIESELDKGTEVTVVLPIHCEATEKVNILDSVFDFSIGTIRKSEPTVEEKIPSFRPKSEEKLTLLIIEDNWDVIDYLKSLLEKEYKISVAVNGQKGIDKAVEEIPDLIVSDVVMPEKNGFEVCEFLKNDERTCHIPILILTAKATIGEKIHGFETGADAYLTKPFHKDELLIRLRNLIDLRKRVHPKFMQGFSLNNLTEDEMKGKDKVFLRSLTDFILKNISDENMDVVRLQRAAKMSRPQLHRKLKSLTGLSASQFRKTIRLQEAKSILEKTDLNISEVAYRVGYKQPSYFSKDFKEMFGMVPGGVR